MGINFGAVEAKVLQTTALVHALWESVCLWLWLQANFVCLCILKKKCIELCTNAQHALEFSLHSCDCSAPMLLKSDNLGYRNTNAIIFITTTNFWQQKSDLDWWLLMLSLTDKKFNLNNATVSCCALLTLCSYVCMRGQQTDPRGPWPCTEPAVWGADSHHLDTLNKDV